LIYRTDFCILLLTRATYGLVCAPHYPSGLCAYIIIVLSDY